MARRSPRRNRNWSAEPLESRMMLDASVVFNEIMYNPAGTDESLEWIELHNQQGVDMDISGWSLTGGVDYTFAQGTVIKGRGFLVVAVDPAALGAATGFTTALGPFSGNLANSGEVLRIRNNSDRLMDEVDFRDSGEWPIAPDGSGASLAKRGPNLGSEPAASWTTSAQVGGTPGAANFNTAAQPPVVSTLIEPDSVWNYNASGANLGVAWVAPAYDDSTWNSGGQLLYAGDAELNTGVVPGGVLANPGAGLTNYWALEQTSGTTAPNSVAGGTTASLFNGVTWINDATRGRVLQFDGVDGYASAGTTPAISPTTSFTMSFWSRQIQAAPPNRPNDVILGNRYPDSGWSKFTPSAFEFRDIAPTFNNTIDYADLSPGVWVHHAVVKSGSTMTYYRNGVSAGSTSVTATMPARPFYFGGDTTNENWNGVLDDIATWNKALPAQAIAGIASGQYTPATAPTDLVGAGTGDTSPGPVVFTEDFSAPTINASEWEVLEQGLENSGPAGYNAPSTTTNAGRLTLSGTATQQYWYGSSIRSRDLYDTQDRVTVTVDRTSLAGTGTAYRSSLWLWGDSGHYVHFSQNIGEGGWTYNSNDVGGTGVLAPTGAGTNLSAFDALDANLGQQEMKIVYEPIAAGRGTISLYLNNVLGASVSVTNWPQKFQVMLTGQARATGDSVTATFDNVRINVNSPPTTPPAIVTSVINDNFTADTINAAAWSTIEYGLETRTAGSATNINANTTANSDRLTIGGTATTNYWAGRSLRSVATFPSNIETTFSVDRVSLSGTGTARRSSIWLWASDSHYIHFSQDVGETGWQYNVNNVGGTGTLNPTGSATNITAFDTLDSDLGAHQMKLVFKPTGTAGAATIEIYLDGTLGATHNVTNWPSQFQVMMTGQARQSGDTVTAVFDNALVTQSSYPSLATQLPIGPTTYYFRKDFEFDGNPERATLLLSPLADDGAVYYLNGVEIYRQNMPLGAITSSTFAATTIGDAGYARTVTLPATALIDGQNVLAVEVHQSGPADTDMLFGAKLDVSVRPPDPSQQPPVVFNEIAAATDPSFWLELTNPGSEPINLTGYSIASSDELHIPYEFPATTLNPGQYLVVTEAQLGFEPADADHLFIYNADGTAVLDGVVVKNRWQGRSTEHDNRWQFPNAATPGAANSFDFESDIVINEIMYHAPPEYASPAVVQTSTLLPIDATWRYFANPANTGLPTGWQNTIYTAGVGGWQSGPGLIGFEPTVLAHPIRTAVPNPVAATPYVISYYFQREFEFNGDLDAIQLTLNHVIDDGAIFYLNGVPVLSFNLSTTGLTPTTFASAGVDNAAPSGPIVISKDQLLIGTNVLSVEVHQNQSASSDIVFGVEVGTQEVITPATPFNEPADQWLELYNRGSQAVDLSGWDFGSGIDYVFPQGTTLAPGGYLVVSNNAVALSAKFPTATVLGNFTGSLSRSGERIELRDAAGNIADEVHYHDDKPWPVFADGGGSSMELRDPRADNSKAESWAASDESAGSQWQTITYSGPATNLVGPSNYNEFILGLLDAGEVLIDDVSVIQDPLGTPRQLIQNGDFQSGTANFWRLLGNHDDSLVITDPSDPSGINKVLKIVATGPTEHMHNHLETTLKDGANYVTINPALTYQISFKAKWVTGSPQVNSRLYFSRLQRTTILDVPEDPGTPGAVNSKFTANTGPTYEDLSHFPVVPAANENVTISVAAADPDGVATMNLRYSVAGGAFATVPMTLSDGKYRAVIPGQAAATVVQFYVEGQDSLGATSTYPAAGAASRALFKVNDGATRPGGGHDITIIMTTADADAMHALTDVMSNGLRGATIIYDSEEVFYDVGIRLKGSEHGRFQSVRVGYVIRFHADQLFRGVEDSIAIDRSGAGDQYSQKEILIKHALNRVGNLPTMYDDLVDIVAPRAAQNGSAMLGMSRYDNDFLDSQYEDGSDGTAFEYELIYLQLGTNTGGPEGLKVPAADTVMGVPLASLGSNPEAYRWNFIIENNRDKDDYSKLMEALAAIGQPAGAQFYADTNRLLDVDEWLRAFALTSLFAVGDNYGTNSQHNLILYTRPSDGKTMFFPHDMDFTFSAGATSSLVTAPDLTKLITLPANRRAFYGHVHDMITTYVNSAYMNQWVTHYDSFLPAEDFSGFASFIATRETNAMQQITAAIPQVPFAITTPNNSSFASSTATINGNGWVNVRTLRLAGEEAALPVTWSTNTGWTATVPIEFGTHPITIEAYNFQDQLIGSATITVTSTVSDRPLQEFLRVTELMYHPADSLETGLDADEFEYIEFRNISTTATLDLTDARIVSGVDFDFSQAAITSLAPGEYVLVVSNPAAFALRYGSGFPIAGEYMGQLNNAGERVRIEDASAVAILDFTYDDTGDGWYPETDGDGYSLVIRNENAAVNTWNDAAAWRASFAIGGSPAAADTAQLEGDVNGDLTVDLVDLAILQAHLGTVAGGQRSQGDLNGDGAINRTDAAILSRNYGRTLSQGGSPAASAPAALAIVASSPRRDATDAAATRSLRASRRISATSAARTPATTPAHVLSAASVDRALESVTGNASIRRSRR